MTSILRTGKFLTFFHSVLHQLLYLSLSLLSVQQVQPSYAIGGMESNNSIAKIVGIPVYLFSLHVYSLNENIDCVLVTEHFPYLVFPPYGK